MFQYYIVETVYKIKRKLYNFWESQFLQKWYKNKFCRFGENVRIGKHCEFFYQNIEIGNDVHIGDRASFIASIAKIHIGDHVIFGPGVTIRGDHRIDIIGKYMMEIKDTDKLPENDADVYIDDDVWIGCNVTILKGVHIGRGSIIGAGSVVVKDVPQYTIHVGSHSPLDKSRFSMEEIMLHEKLLLERREES